MISQKCRISLYSFIVTMVLLVSAMNAMSLFPVSEWIGVSIGGAAFVIMLIILIASVKRLIPHVVALFVNATASGIAASSLFVYLGAFPEIWHTYALVTAFGALFALYCLLANIGFLKRHYIISMLIFVAVVSAANIALAVMTEHPVFKLSLLCLIPFIFFLFTVISNADDGIAQIKIVAYCSFAVLILVVFVVLVIISEGDAASGLDGIGDFAPSRKRDNPYGYREF